MSKPNEKPMMHFTADVLPASVLALRVEGIEGTGPDGTLSTAQRAELLKAVRAGEFTGPLLVDATTFIQRPTPNRNYSRFARGTLRSGARSFVGQVVLLDHDQRSQQARIGTIVKSQAGKDEQGNITFAMTLSIAKQHAIESVLDGTIDRFSIGWFPTGPITCSVHDQPLYGAGCCPCWPGETVNGKKVEAIYTAWEGVEVSAVNVPAVVGTGIDQIRAALTALRAEHQPTKNKDTTNMNIRSFLGLAETATDDEVTAALAARAAADKERSDQLALLQSQAQQNEQALVASRQQRLDAAITAAKGDGRLFIARDSSGKEVASELETRVRSVGKTDVDTAIALLEAMPKSHPNGNPAALQSSTTPAPAPKQDGVQMTNALESMMPLMGLDANDVKDYGPQHRRASAKDSPVPRHLTKLFTTRHMGQR